MTTRRVGLLAFALAAGAFGVPQACTTEKAGAIVVAMQTDMSVPKDVTHVGVFISSDGIVKVASVVPAGEDALGRRTVKLPATIAVVANEDKPNARVRVRIMGFQRQGPVGTNETLKARVVREAVTTVPQNRQALLRMPIQFVSDGSASGVVSRQRLTELGTKSVGLRTDELDDKLGTAGEITFRCPVGQTDVLGECKSNEIDASTLPTYREEAVFGGASQARAQDLGRCFDVAQIYRAAEQVIPVLDKASPDYCTLALDVAQPKARLNFALWSDAAAGGAGVCNAEGRCFVPLDGAGSTEPAWTVSQGTDDTVAKVRFASGICQKLLDTPLKLGRPAARLPSGQTAALQVPAKTDELPVCGGATGVAVGTDGATTLPPTALVDAGGDAPIVDAGGDGSTPPDAGSDSGPSDASTDASAKPWNESTLSMFGLDNAGNDALESQLSGLAAIGTGVSAGVYVIRKDTKSVGPLFGRYEVRRVPLNGVFGVGPGVAVCEIVPAPLGTNESLRFSLAATPTHVGVALRSSAALVEPHSSHCALANIPSPVVPILSDTIGVVAQGNTLRWIRDPGSTTMETLTNGVPGTEMLAVNTSSYGTPIGFAAAPGVADTLLIASQKLANAFVQQCVSPQPWPCEVLNTTDINGFIQGVVADATKVYALINVAGGVQIYKLPRAAGPAEVFANAGTPFSPSAGIAITADSKWLFFGTSLGLRALELATKQIVNVGPTAESSGDVLAFGDHVYFIGCKDAGREQCALRRVTPPK
jgi:hypothetical protein